MADASAVALFWGDDGFLLRLAAHALLEARGLRATEVAGADWRGGETADLATPSLWGEGRALLVVGCQDLPEAGAREVKSYLQGPSSDALLVLTLASRAKQPPPLARAVQASGGLVRQVGLGRQELGRWVADRGRVRGVRLSPQAAAALVGAVGEDTATLDQAVEQLATAFQGRPVGPEEVRAQFRGLGEHRVWAMCDQALAGRLGPALVALRGLLEAREDPLLILGGIASRVRDLVRVRAVPDRATAAEAAKATGVRFEWQIRRYREQSSRFTPEELALLQRRVVEADRALKGGVPGEVLLPALVAAMAGEPDAALDVSIRVSR